MDTRVGSQENALQLKSFTYHPSSGWSVADFPDLDSSETLVFVSGAPAMAASDALSELRRAYPSAHILGGSSAGDISDGRIYDGGLAVSVVRFSRTRLKSVSVPVRTIDRSYDAGARVASRLDGDDLAAVLVVADGLATNGSEFVRGLNEIFEDRVIVTGALASDSPTEEPWVLKSGAPKPSFVSAVGLYGNHVEVSTGQGGGWTVFGPERRITRTEGLNLYELDGSPALELLERYLGEYASELPGAAHHLPIAIQERNELTEVEIARTAIDVDEEHQSLRLTGEVTEGARVHLARPCHEKLVAGANDAASAVMLTADEDATTFAFAVSHTGRRLAMGTRTEEELDIMLARLPDDTLQAGLYGLGELAPNDAGECGLFNMTMTLTIIQEAA
jgi:hypothetical protein